MRNQLLPVLALVLHGCASIVGGQNQSVSVVTPGCEGANCELSNDKGKWFVASTPGTVTVVRSFNNLQVVCRKQGQHEAIASFASSTKGLAFGNILAGGVIGAGIDIGTGAAYDYPQTITVAMGCEGPAGIATAAATSTSTGGVRLGCSVRALSPEAAGQAGLRTGQGLLVTRVSEEGAAQRGGIRPGDIMLRLDGIALRDADDLAARLASHPIADALAITLLRGDAELTLSVPADEAAPNSDGDRK